MMKFKKFYNQNTNTYTYVGTSREIQALYNRLTAYDNGVYYPLFQEEHRFNSHRLVYGLEFSREGSGNCWYYSVVAADCIALSLMNGTIEEFTDEGLPLIDSLCSQIESELLAKYLAPSHSEEPLEELPEEEE